MGGINDTSLPGSAMEDMPPGRPRRMTEALCFAAYQATPRLHRRPAGEAAGFLTISGGAWAARLTGRPGNRAPVMVWSFGVLS